MPPALSFIQYPRSEAKNQIAAEIFLCFLPVLPIFWADRAKPVSDSRALDFSWELWMGRGQSDEFLDNLKKTLHEITAAAPFLVGDTVTGETTTDTPNVSVMQKRSQHGDLWIVINESPDPKRVELKGDFPRNIAELSGKEMPSSDGGKLAFGLPGLAPYGRGAWLSNVSARPYERSRQPVPLPKE